MCSMNCKLSLLFPCHRPLAHYAICRLYPNLIVFIVRVSCSFVAEQFDRNGSTELQLQPAPAIARGDLKADRAAWFAAYLVFLRHSGGGLCPCNRLAGQMSSSCQCMPSSQQHAMEHSHHFDGSVSASALIGASITCKP